MSDLLFVVLTIGSFALAAGLVKVCDGFIDEEPIERDGAAGESPDRSAAPSGAAAGGRAVEA
jgi:hypothetical protein